MTEDNLNSNHIPYGNEEVNRANQKRSKSKLWHYLTKVNPDHANKLTEQITPRGILSSIKHQQNNRAVGTDYIPPEILKSCLNWFAKHLHPLFIFHHINEFPKIWKTGVIALLYKSGSKCELKNYRPITLLNTIYKIWDTIMTNRLTLY